MNEEAIIKDYRETFRKYAKDGIIDMDRRLQHKFSFQVHRLETIIREFEGIVPLNRFSHFYITFVKKGCGEKIIGHFTFPIKPNTLFIVPKRAINGSKYWPIDCTGYLVSFNVEFFLQNAFPRHHLINKKILKSSIKPFLVLSEDQVNKIDVIYEGLLKEEQQHLKGKNEMIALKVLELLVQCDRFFTDAEMLRNEDIYDDVVESFTDLIQKNFTKQRSVLFYANALHMHPNHLNFLIKKHTGLTAKGTIINHILLEAKFLLSSSSLSIKEIAFKLGFDNPNYFSAFFRKNSKVSPESYRRQPV